MDSSETTHCPPAYIKSLPGILKCVELVRTKPECFQSVECFVTPCPSVVCDSDTQSSMSLRVYSYEIISLLVTKKILEKSKILMRHGAA